MSVGPGATQLTRTPLWRNLEGEALGHGVEGSLGRRVVRCVRVADQAELASDGADRTPATGQHPRQNGPPGVHRPPDVQLEHLVPRSKLEGLDERRAVGAGGGHQVLDGPELDLDSSDRLDDRRLVADIEPSAPVRARSSVAGRAPRRRFRFRTELCTQAAPMPEPPPVTRAAAASDDVPGHQSGPTGDEDLDAPLLVHRSPRVGTRLPSSGGQSWHLRQYEAALGPRVDSKMCLPRAACGGRLNRRWQDQMSHFAPRGCLVSWCRWNLRPRPIPDSQVESGSDAAFERFFRAQYPVVVRVAYSVVGDSQTAQDVAQDVFIAAQRRYSGLNGPGHAAAWVRVAAVHAGLNAVRGRRRLDARRAACERRQRPGRTGRARTGGRVAPGGARSPGALVASGRDSARASS